MINLVITSFRIIDLLHQVIIMCTRMFLEFNLTIFSLFVVCKNCRKILLIINFDNWYREKNFWVVQDISIREKYRLKAGILMYCL